MAVIAYRPQEGKGARIIAAVSLLALGLLGLFQLYFFLIGLWGKSLGAEDEKMTVAMVDELVVNAPAIESRLGRSYVTMKQSVFDLATRAVVEEPMQLQLGDAERIDQVKSELSRGGYQTGEPIHQIVHLAEGPRPLNQTDIKRILASDSAPLTIPVSGEPRPWLISQLRDKVGKLLYAIGAVAPFPEAASSPNALAKLSQLVIYAVDVREQHMEKRLPENKVVLAAAVPANADKTRDELPAGTKVEDLLTQLAKFDATETVTLKHVDDPECLEVPLQKVRDGSILCAPLYAPTLVSLEEDIIVDATTLIERGTALSQDHLTLLEGKGIKSILVQVDRTSLAPAEAVGSHLAEAVTTAIPVGTRLDGELVAIVRAQHAADLEAREVQVASVQNRLDLSGEEAEVRALLLGKEVSAARVLPESKVLAEAPADPAATTMTLADYWAKIAEFNKGYAADARWRQAIDTRDLWVRAPGDAEEVKVDVNTPLTTLTDYVLAEEFLPLVKDFLPQPTDAAALEYLKAGHISTALSAQDIKQSMMLPGAPGKFRAWKLKKLTKEDLADYAEGPEQVFTFKAFANATGDVLIAQGQAMTAAQLLELPRIGDITAAVEKDNKLIEVELADKTGVQFRTVDYFRQEVARWKKLVVLQENIAVDVPRVLIEAGTKIDETNVDDLLKKLKELPRDEQWVIGIGECGAAKVSELQPDLFVVCDVPLELTLPADHQLTKTTSGLLAAMGLAEVNLRGGSRTLALADIGGLIQKGTVVQSLIPLKEGGEQLAAKGDSLTLDLLDRCEAKGLTELTVSGTRVDKPIVDLLPNDRPADAKGIAIREPLMLGDKEVGKNVEVTVDLMSLLADRKDSNLLGFPIVLESTDPKAPDTIRIESAEQWGELQRATASTFLLDEGISLPGPLSKSLFGIGTEYSVNWGGMICLAFLVGLVLLVLRVVNHPKLSDLLIDTESEMRKVSWPSREDLIGSSQVVILTVIALAIFMLVADYLLNLILGWILV